MHDLEGGDAEGTHLKGRVELRDALERLRDFLRHETVAMNAHVDALRSVDGQMLLDAEGTDGLDVVRVVVGDENRLDVGHAETVITGMSLEGTYADAEVYDDGCSARFEIVAVATRATAETKEFHV